MGQSLLKWIDPLLIDSQKPPPPLPNTSNSSEEELETSSVSSRSAVIDLHEEPLHTVIDGKFRADCVGHMARPIPFL